MRTARAWSDKEQLREIRERKRINVVRVVLQHWCTCVIRSKVEPMEEFVALVRNRLEGIVAWAQTRQTNGFLEALNGLVRAAKRRARGFTRMSPRTVIFLIAGKSLHVAFNSGGRLRGPALHEDWAVPLCHNLTPLIYDLNVSHDYPSIRFARGL